MKRYMVYILILILSVPLWAEKATAEEILKAVDNNMISTTSKARTRMIVHSRRASRTMEAINYSRGNSKFYSEYLAPPREKGTKMLKLEDDLWIYDPGTDRSIQISGNMLKQSVMGSDLSYEDMMEESTLLEDYSATLKGEISYDKRPCWILELIARRDKVTYYKRMAYIDKERNVPLYEEWYAKSGKLLKTVKYWDVQRVGGRWYPMAFEFKDALKKGKGTQYFIDEIELDIAIPDHIFSKAMLRK